MDGECHLCARTWAGPEKGDSGFKIYHDEIPGSLLLMFLSYSNDIWAISEVLIVVGLVAQLCLTLCDPMDCGPPGSSVHGMLQARILE